MPVNEFLPFAAAPGANVLSQAAYASLPAVSTGFQAGTAQSAHVNKALRQSSAVAAALGNLIVAQAGVDAQDDGDTAELTASLLAAFTNIAQSANNGIRVLSSVPSTNVGPTIYVPPYGVMNWVTAISAYRSERCGDIVLLAGSTARAGTHEFDGAVVPKVGLYASVWAWAQGEGITTPIGSWTIGTLTFGDVDGANFKFPDIRGDFFRVWDHGAGIDAARARGSHQDQAIQAHTHSTPVDTVNHTDSGSVVGLTDGPNPSPGSLASNSTGGAETRPRNVAVMAAIYI